MKQFFLLFILSASTVFFTVPSSAQTPATTAPSPSTTSTSGNNPSSPGDNFIPDENLLLNPSFEEPAPALTDDKSLPGWKLKIQGKLDGTPLFPGEVTLIDDPAQAHSGRYFLRFRPKNRVIYLMGPERPQGYEPGLYDVSAWVRMFEGAGPAAGGVVVPVLGPNSTFLKLAENGLWQKMGNTVYSKGVTHLSWPDQGRFDFIAGTNVDVDDASVVRLTCGLSDTFGDHMVLQRQRPVPVWGWAEHPNQTIIVKFNGQSATTTSDKDGRWRVTLQPMQAGGPYILELNGRPTAQDVMVGDVWICSGQSNMEFGIDLVNGYYKHAPEVTSKADCPQIRLWQASKQWSATPMHDYPVRQGDPNRPYQGIWNICTPETVLRGIWGGFSAIGYCFGREIQEDQKIPIGLMMIANGGTQIESFISPEGLQTIPQDQWRVKPPTPEDLARLDTLPKLPPNIDAPTPAYAEAIVRYTTTRKDYQPGFKATDFQHPYAAYNGLLAPVFPFAVRGVIWFQGEHNGGDVHYEAKLKAMIADWRTRFEQKDLPFIIGQLCNLNMPFNFHVVRDAQLKVSQTEPNTALAVTIDLADKEGGGPMEIHFRDKQDVGHRMALAARALVYGEKIVSSGPQYQSMKQEGGKIRLSFNSVGGGLEANGGKLIGFKIAGDDHNFVDADAVIDGDTILVSAPSVPNPVAVRYAIENFVHPLCTLYNKDGLPASPFRTDDWSLESEPKAVGAK